MNHEDKTVWYAFCYDCETVFYVARHVEAEDDLPDHRDWGGIMGDSFTCLVCDGEASFEGTDRIGRVLK